MARRSGVADRTGDWRRRLAPRPSSSSNLRRGGGVLESDLDGDEDLRADGGLRGLLSSGLRPSRAPGI